MAQSLKELRLAALTRLKAKTYENSRAKRLGTQTREEWEAAKVAEINHLEELIHGRKTS